MSKRINKTINSSDCVCECLSVCVSDRVNHSTNAFLLVKGDGYRNEAKIGLFLLGDHRISECL